MVRVSVANRLILSISYVRYTSFATQGSEIGERVRDKVGNAQ